MFMTFEDRVRQVRENQPSLARFDNLLEQAEGSAEKFELGREAILASFRSNLEKLQEMAAQAGEEEGEFFADIFQARQAVLLAIERRENAHFIERTGNGVTIPGSSELNIEPVRLSWLEVQLAQEAAYFKRQNEST